MPALEEVEEVVVSPLKRQTAESPKKEKWITNLKDESPPAKKFKPEDITKEDGKIRMGQVVFSVMDSDHENLLESTIEDDDDSDIEFLTEEKVTNVFKMEDKAKKESKDIVESVVQAIKQQRKEDIVKKSKKKHDVEVVDLESSDDEEDVKATAKVKSLGITIQKLPRNSMKNCSVSLTPVKTSSRSHETKKVSPRRQIRGQETPRGRGRCEECGQEEEGRQGLEPLQVWSNSWSYYSSYSCSCF